MVNHRHVEPGSLQNRQTWPYYPDAAKAALCGSRRDYAIRLIDSLYEYHDAACITRAPEWPVLTAVFPELTPALIAGTSTARGLHAVLSGDRAGHGAGYGPMPRHAGGSEALLDSLDIAVYTTDSEGRVTFFNEAAVRLWGWRPPLYHQVWCGSWRIHAPDGSPLPHDQCPMAICLREKRPVRDNWAYAEQPGGARVAVAPIPTPLLDDDGAVFGAYNVLVDVSDAVAA